MPETTLGIHQALALLIFVSVVPSGHHHHQTSCGRVNQLAQRRKVVTGGAVTQTQAA